VQHLAAIYGVHAKNIPTGQFEDEAARDEADRRHLARWDELAKKFGLAESQAH
jgi:hypothetical protein